MIRESDAIRDTEGVVVADLRHARDQGLQAIDELRREDPPAGAWEGWELVATDATDAVLFSIRLDACENPSAMSSFEH
ncbi:DUF6894 family protein [Microvirga yunnanensis]|uniref:DUF6894 family protein n=1 Tax=Microvirga yunnanensis TaxID=2953740 RepID=UPI0021C70ECD|nr:hypothetical protein [Microvirga sp. HBU65207]